MRRLGRLWAVAGLLWAVALLMVGARLLRDEPRPAAAGSTVAPAPSRPASVLLLTLDTTRADHLSGYGYERPTTPALDRLARDGVLVTRVITPMPTTDPAHLSLLTGLFPRTHGSRRNGVPAVPGLANLASWAHHTGRRTAAFVSRKHLQPDELGIEGFESADGPEGPQRPGGETLTRALRWLDRHGGEPFFLWVHFFDPHRPYAAPPPFGRRFVPPSLGEVPPIQVTRHLTPEKAELFTAQYDGEVAYVDSLVGQLLDRVREMQAPEPLVVAVGDHGEAMGELYERHRFAFGHGKLLYQGILHVPLILRWRGHLPEGRRVDRLVSLVDLPATLFDILGEDGFATAGTSFAPAIRSPAPGPGDRTVVTERRELDPEQRSSRDLPEAQLAIQDDRYKLILSLPDETVELYDLVEDPGETRDLSGSDPRIVARLREALAAWQDRTPEARPAGTPVEPERIEALRSLGYVQ